MIRYYKLTIYFLPAKYKYLQVLNYSLSKNENKMQENHTTYGQNKTLIKVRDFPQNGKLLHFINNKLFGRSCGVYNSCTTIKMQILRERERE